MLPTRRRQIYLNLPVNDLNRSVEYFTKLGFKFNPQFTDDTAACMVLNAEAYVMLLTETRFKDFTKKQLAPTRTHTEGIFALSAESRAEVDEFTDTALKLGGKPAMEPMDLGMMYARSFYDLDDHHWEIMWMDMSQAAAPGSGP